MEVIDVLGDQEEVRVALFHPRQGQMSRVRARLGDLPLTEAIHIPHSNRVPGEALHGSQSHRVVLFPETIVLSECGQARFLAYPGSGKDKYAPCLPERAQELFFAQSFTSLARLRCPFREKGFPKQPKLYLTSRCRLNVSALPHDRCHCRFGVAIQPVDRLISGLYVFYVALSSSIISSISE